jgi:polyvinyl alcohol dehydrogenase (cytochrome)
MGSRRTRSSSTVLALAALGAGALSAYAFGCGSNQTSSGPSDGGPSAESGPLGPFPDAGGLQCSAESTDWPMFGQNVCNTNAQAAAGGLSAATAGSLGVKWVYSAKGDVSATPSVVAGAVYFPDWGGNIDKVDANTGAEIWSKSITTILAGAGDAGSKLPGFASRNAPVISGSNVIFGTLRSTQLITDPGPSAYLVALDTGTAALSWATMLDDHQAAVIAGSPVLDGTTLYIGVSSQEEFSSLTPVLRPGATYTCCSFRGSVVAVDATTGAIKWKTYTISDSLYYANDAGKLSGFAGNAVWSSTPVVDRKRHQIYITTGNNYHYSSPKEAEAGASEGNFVDSVMALDSDTGAIKWAQSLPEGGEDLWVLNDTPGQDSDFGAGANLFTATINGKPTDVVGAGQKSGMYWAFDANTGEILWKTQVGPGGHLGGIHWGTATDGTRIYTEVNYGGSKPFALGGTGPMAGTSVSTGTWAALDPGTGDILWQIANPVLSAPLSGASCNGPVAVVNGVLFAGSMDAQGTMFAIDATSGNVLWQYPSGGTVYGGPAISNGVVYWGSGYPSSVRPLGFGTSSMKLYAFAVGAGDAGAESGTPEAGSDAGASDGSSDAPSE